MITIAEAISDLLFVRDTVVVPGLGAFVKKSVSAKVNPVANYFAAPSSLIEFDGNLREDNDLVINYISEKNNIPVDEARRLLAMFVSDCFNSLKAGKKVTLNSIGTLFNDGAGDLVFTPDKSVNYNADAFGLCDFTPEPVLRSKTKEEIKVEIERQQKDKNTPVTVDEKEVHKKDETDNEGDDEPRRRLGWLWVLLGLLLAAGIVLGLHYFKVIDLGKLIHGTPKRTIDIKPGQYVLPTYNVDWDDVLKQYEATWKPAEPEVTEDAGSEVPIGEENPTVTPAEQGQTVALAEQGQTEAPAEQGASVTPSGQGQTVAQPEANIFVVAGCFSQENNAVLYTNTLKEKGYSNAFHELRGKQWYVYFGRYATDEEAKAMWREVNAKGEYKAWILK